MTTFYEAIEEITHHRAQIARLESLIQERWPAAGKELLGEQTGGLLIQKKSRKTVVSESLTPAQKAARTKKLKKLKGDRTLSKNASMRKRMKPRGETLKQVLVVLKGADKPMTTSAVQKAVKRDYYQVFNALAQLSREGGVVSTGGIRKLWEIRPQNGKSTQELD